MEGPKNHGHQHPLLMLNEEQLINNGGGAAQCSRCWEKVSAPCFSCVEDCGFYLHKLCADAPSGLNHPFHRPHPLVLQQSSSSSITRCVCDFCAETCKNLVYHCSCGLNFHIKCALLTFNIAKKNLQELEHVAVEDPSVSPKTDESLSKCFGCWEPLANYVHFSLDCGFKLHKKCAELSLKINHSCHRKHPLFLQFNSERLSCKICQVTGQRGFVYGCFPCKFVVHIECLAPLPIIEDRSHQHPFTLLWRQTPFICDACGSEGNHVAYTCSTCSIVVHRKCISLPRIIQHIWHEHRVSHTYFLHKEDFRSWDCVMCHDVVDTDHGSYCCADCDAIFHVNCAMKEEYWYSIVSLENEDDKSLNDMSVNSITNVLERNDAGEATLIEHFRHKHYLMLTEEIRGYDDKCCDGCLLPVSALFYYCSLCDFFLHKACAELPRKAILTLHHASPQILTTDIIFRCTDCNYLSNGFFYKCTDCGHRSCLRCATLKPDGVRCAGHKHPLFFYFDFKDRCSACGRNIVRAFRCKDCNFNIDNLCVQRNIRARHRCDEHLLTLTYDEANDYSEYHYCDICERRRDPNHWFYHCATCDTSAHVDCVLGEYPFFKLGSSYKAEAYHPHPLTFVKKFYDYPECNECGKPCQDLALECAEPGCNYMVHWECI